MTSKEQRIINTIEEITGKRIDVKSDITQISASEKRSKTIHTILIFSSSYDYFLITEEERLSELFNQQYSHIDQIHPPSIIHTTSHQETKQVLASSTVDLLIIFNRPDNIDILPFTHEIKKTYPLLPIVVLGNNIGELMTLQKQDLSRTVDHVFTWNGDGKIIPAIIQLFEDTHHLSLHGTNHRNIILLIEDSIQYYSSYLITIYDEILHHLNQIIDDQLTTKQKLVRYMNRPFIILKISFQQGKEFYDNHTGHFLCLIIDNHVQIQEKKPYERGIQLATELSKDHPQLPILIQSSEPLSQKTIPSKNISFVLKKTPSLNKQIQRYLTTQFGTPQLELKNKEKEKSILLKTIEDFDQLIHKKDMKLIEQHASQHNFSNWMNALWEYELSERIRQAESVSNQRELYQKFIDIMEEYQYSIHSASIGQFERAKEDTTVKIRRIGNGALGGKARGLAFLAKILTRYMPTDLFPDITITIPRTIVLTTDVFDDFLKHNHLFTAHVFQQSDERIAALFMKGTLPATILGDLRSFIRKTRKPLIIRSSGMLEDSLLQPFAGIYASMLLPNESWETDLRFQEVCNAIKYVYASTYFEKARTYVKSTPKNIGDEKMGVIIQEVIGDKHGQYFYPIISGVAKSYNHYPSGPCKPEDGVVYLALGLGKAIVDGGASYCFCPKYPKTPLSGTPKDFIRYSQRKFYAVNLTSVYSTVNKSEETSVDKLEIDHAKKHGTLSPIASTYYPQDDQLIAGFDEEGSAIINFSPILEYEQIPLAKALRLLIAITEIALGYPVEIEFAVSYHEETTPSAELVILQIRSMIPTSHDEPIDISKYDENDVICYSKNALGNEIIKTIDHVLFVKSDRFDMANTQRVVNQLREINTNLMESQTPYLLIGPGRWGSSDPWMGIPVYWSDIAGAKVIIETPVKDAAIEPSQGSHFFHDMVSSQVGYIIIEKKSGSLDMNYIKRLEPINETEDLCLVKTSHPLEIRINGKQRTAVILK